MSKKHRIGIVFSVVLGLASAAQAEIRIEILHPTGREPLFGMQEIIVDVDEGDSQLDLVDFYLDGLPIAVLHTPPFRVEVNVGERNLEHVFRAVARTEEGDSAEAIVTTPRVQVDMEIDVDLQQLYVTVTKGGQRKLDLEQGDFKVIDDGKTQEIVTFARGDVSLAAVLLLDSSESMKGERLRSAVEGAETFVRGMRELDEAMVVLFSDRMLRATPFTGNLETLASSLAGVSAAGGTAVNDHLFLALQVLEERQGRRVVVLLSDGADVLSALRMQDVLWKVRRSQALIYWIRLREQEKLTSFSSAFRDFAANRIEQEELELAVGESGGRIVTIGGLDKLSGAFQEILAELRDQYVLGYYPSVRRRDGKWREIKIKVDGFGTDVRAREGWVDW